MVVSLDDNNTVILRLDRAVLKLLLFTTDTFKVLVRKVLFRYIPRTVVSRQPIQDAEGSSGASLGSQGLAERDHLLGREPVHLM